MSELGELSTNPEGRALWIAAWLDPALEIPSGLSVEKVVEAEMRRIERAISIILYASTIPRRLGGDATREELAEDKRRCRRVAHALLQSYRGWSKDELKPLDTESVRQTGAQLLWESFAAEHLVEMQTRARLAVTWAVSSGETRWAKKAATNFTNEQRWFTYAMR